MCPRRGCCCCYYPDPCLGDLSACPRCPGPRLTSLQGTATSLCAFAQPTPTGPPSKGGEGAGLPLSRLPPETGGRRAPGTWSGHLGSVVPIRLLPAQRVALPRGGGCQLLFGPLSAFLGCTNVAAAGPPPPRPHLPDTLGHGPHGLLRNEDVAGEATEKGVLGDEPKIAAREDQPRVRPSRQGGCQGWGPRPTRGLQWPICKESCLPPHTHTGALPSRGGEPANSARALPSRHPFQERATHQLLRGWQPQKETFFIWKKWLQRSN